MVPRLHRCQHLPEAIKTSSFHLHTFLSVPKSKKSTIQVQGHAVTVVAQSASDYISVTDIARYRNTQEPFAVFDNWMRSRSTIEFIGLWEKLCNPLFKPLEFGRFKTRKRATRPLQIVTLSKWHLPIAIGTPQALFSFPLLPSYFFHFPPLGTPTSPSAAQALSSLLLHPSDFP